MKFFKIILLTNIIIEYITIVSLFKIRSKFKSSNRFKINKNQLECNLTFEEIVTTKGYNYEKHFIKTIDGYILKTYRLLKRKDLFNKFNNDNNSISNNSNTSNNTVLLVHGLIDSSDSWISNYNNKSIAFLLLNNNYDVWIANSRGNKHSRNHTYLDPDTNRIFWNFTFEDMGVKDIPSIIDYINIIKNKNYVFINNTLITQQGIKIIKHNEVYYTENKAFNLSSSINNNNLSIYYNSLNSNIQYKITYIGHSQGTAQIFAAYSLFPNYFKSVLNGIIALGPVSCLEYIDSPIIKFIANKNVENLLYYLNVNEILTTKSDINRIVKFICDILLYLCEELLEMISDKDSYTDNDIDKILVWASHFPSGTSSKNLIHFSKIIRNKKFIDFNEKEYNLLNINTKVALFIGSNDKLSTLVDSRLLRNLFIKNDSLFFYKEYKLFGHATFFLNKNIEYIEDVLSCLDYFTRYS